MLPFLILVRRMLFFAISFTLVALVSAFPFLGVFLAFGLFPLSTMWLNHNWHKIFDKSNKKAKKFWQFSNIKESLIASLIAVISILLTVAPFTSRYVYVTNTMAFRMTILLLFWATVFYAIVGGLEYLVNILKSKFVKTKPASKKVDSVDDELSKLKQRVQNEDGYLSKPKRPNS